MILGVLNHRKESKNGQIHKIYEGGRMKQDSNILEKMKKKDVGLRKKKLNTN
jgi:hypothetical protein